MQINNLSILPLTAKISSMLKWDLFFAFFAIKYIFKLRGPLRFFCLSNHRVRQDGAKNGDKVVVEFFCLSHHRVRQDKHQEHEGFSNPSCPSL